MDLAACHRVIVFGGTFDPPHTAHVALPLMARQAIAADAVAYVPAARSPFKRDQPVTAAHHRLAMLRLTLEHVAGTVILTDEVDRAATGEPSYTVETLEGLRARLPATVQLRLLIGADQARQFDAWRSPQRIIELAEPLVMLRPPQTRESFLASLPAGFDAAAWNRRLVALPQLDVSATEIRRRVAAGLPTSGLVHPAVEDYIRRAGLYR